MSRSRTRAYVRALAFAGLGVSVIVACSAAGPAESAAIEGDGGGAPALGPDSGGGSGGGSGSSSGSGSGSSSGGSSGGADGAAVVGPTTILAVHASANLYDFRLCFGTEDGVIVPVPAYPDDPAHPMPETNYPGVPVGGAALLPAIPLYGGSVNVFVIPAYYLKSQGYVAGSEPTCDQLIPGFLIPQNVEYFALPPVALPALGVPLVLAIEGCGAGTGLVAGSVAQCGAGYVASTGNLTALAGTLASPAGEDAGGAWGMQLAQLSPSFNQGAGAAVTYIDPSIDASVALSAPAATVGAPTTVPLSEAGVTTAYFALGASGGAVTQGLASIQYFQAPSSDPFTYFSAPTTYFVAVVGDATDAAAPASLPDGAVNPAFDGHGVHVIAYPEQ